MKTISSLVIAMALLFGLVSNSVAENKATTALYNAIQTLLATPSTTDEGANTAMGAVLAYLDEDKGNNVQVSVDEIGNNPQKVFSAIARYYENNQGSRDMNQRTFVITALKSVYPANNPALKGKSLGLGYFPISKVWAASTFPMQVRIKNAATVSVYDNMLFGYYAGVRNAENFIVPDEDNTMENIVYNVILNYIKTHPESVFKDKDTFLPPAQIAPGVVIKALEARYKRG